MIKKLVFAIVLLSTFTLAFERLSVNCPASTTRPYAIVTVSYYTSSALTCTTSGFTLTAEDSVPNAIPTPVPTCNPNTRLEYNVTLPYPETFLFNATQNSDPSEGDFRHDTRNAFFNHLPRHPAPGFLPDSLKPN